MRRLSEYEHEDTSELSQYAFCTSISENMYNYFEIL
jgi:hypothetical protein